MKEIESPPRRTKESLGLKLVLDFDNVLDHASRAASLASSGSCEKDGESFEVAALESDAHSLAAARKVFRSVSEQFQWPVQIQRRERTAGDLYRHFCHWNEVQRYHIRRQRLGDLCFDLFQQLLPGLLMIDFG